MEDPHSFPCSHCGAQNACPESFALAYAGRRVTRSCESCRRLFDVELPPRRTLGDVLFGKPMPPPTPEREWVELVRSVGAGSVPALYTVYTRLHRIIFTFMLRMFRDREVAERLTLEAFYDVWWRAWRYDSQEASAIGWILQQARTRAIDHLQFGQVSRRSEKARMAWPVDELVPFAPSLWERLAQRVAGESSSVTGPMPEPSAAGEWQDAGPGILYKVLSRDVERARVSMLVRLAPGAAYPPHTHADLEELYLLDGELWIDSEKIQPGEYHRADAASSDQRVWTETGCTCVLLTSTADILR